MDLTEKTSNANRHPWELSRCRCLIRSMRTISRDATIADVGAGDRYFANQLAAITSGPVYAVDTKYPANRSNDGGVILVNKLAAIEDDSIDTLVMMDVLEHVKHEAPFLDKALAKLRPGGRLFLTVPAMQFLFSAHDVFLKHHHRYDRRRLLAALQRDDLAVERCHYFYGSLFIARCLAKLLEWCGATRMEPCGIGSWPHPRRSPITRFVAFVLNVDFQFYSLLGRHGIHLPGLSLLAVCKKAS